MKYTEITLVLVFTIKISAIKESRAQAFRFTHLNVYPNS